jgi:hypothetical protein
VFLLCGADVSYGVPAKPAPRAVVGVHGGSGPESCCAYALVPSISPGHCREAISNGGCFGRGGVGSRRASCRAIDEFAETGDGVGDFARGYFRSLVHITFRTVPWILLGIWVSMIIANRIPIQTLASSGPKVIILLVVATGALLLTLPSFFETPLALSLLAEGASTGTALAVLIAVQQSTFRPCWSSRDTLIGRWRRWWARLYGPVFSQAQRQEGDA